jgi:hypothetical protein
VTSASELKQQVMPGQDTSEEEARAALERLERQNEEPDSRSCSIRCKTATTPEEECECSCGGSGHGSIAETNQTLDEVYGLQ